MKEKLQKASVAVAGLGGLGSNIAVSLARSGVGHLLLVDFDIVDVTNLNRQMYTIPHLGMPKTQALHDILMQINPWLDIQTRQIRVTSENVRQNSLAAGRSYARPLTGRTRRPCWSALSSRSARIPLLSPVTAWRVWGTQTTSGHSRSSEGSMSAGTTTTESAPGAGLMAPRVAICAGHQANKVLQLIIGEQEKHREQEHY